MTDLSKNYHDLRCTIGELNESIEGPPMCAPHFTEKELDRLTESEFKRLIAELSKSNDPRGND